MHQVHYLKAQRRICVLKAIKLEITDYLAELIDSRINFDMMSILRNKSEFKYYFFNLLFHGYDNKPKRIYLQSVKIQLLQIYTRLQ